MRQAARKRVFQRNLNELWQLKKKRRQQRNLTVKTVCCAQNAKTFTQLDTFHRAIRPYLCLAHVFGMLPLVNVLSRNPENVKFQLRSLGMFLSVLFLVLGSLKTIHIAGKLFEGGLNAKNMPYLVFYSMSMIVCLNFISFARCWSRLIMLWSRIDLIMLYSPYKPTKRSLRYKLHITGCFLGLLTLIEHIFYYVNSTFNYRQKIMFCEKNVTHIPFNSYVKEEFTDIFEILPCHPILIFYAFILNFTFTFIINFMDMFIILISIALAQRFEQFANRVQALENRHVPDILWHQLRKHHMLLCELMELVESNMSHIVLVSCLNNIYFICYRLLAIFVKLRYPINYAYFWYGLLFLLGRTCTVFLCASKIHDASQLPLRVVSMVSSERWTEEVQRLQEQLVSQHIGLSGLRLFYLTRESFFGMMSTLVYYEFMLLQLDAKSHKDELPDLCV